MRLLAEILYPLRRNRTAVLGARSAPKRYRQTSQRICRNIEGRALGWYWRCCWRSPRSPRRPTDPFPNPIPATEGVIRVGFVEFASIPDVGGESARMMLLVDEPGTRRMFVNEMRGPLFTVGYDGRTVTQYLDINAGNWGVGVQSSGRERGFQSFAIHPQFGQPGTPGFGKLYTWADTSDTAPAPDFAPAGETTPTPRFCSNGPPGILRRRPMMAARRGNCFGSSSRFATTTLAT